MLEERERQEMMKFSRSVKSYLYLDDLYVQRSNLLWEVVKLMRTKQFRVEYGK